MSEPTSVILKHLAFVPDPLNLGLEPQTVMVRAPNSSYVYLDSNNKGAYDSNTKLILSTTVQYIVRWAVESFSYCWITPNVNLRNNIITFRSSVSGLNHSVRIPEGFYTTDTGAVNNIYDALKTELNSVTGASGLTWDITITNPHNPFTRQLTTAPSGSFYFINDDNVYPEPLTPIITGEIIRPTSYYMTRGKHLWNLPLAQSLAATRTMGPCCMNYTRFIDIRSSALSQYTKNTNVSSADGAVSSIIRVPIDGTLGYREIINQNLRWCYYNKKRSLGGIDFLLFDEWKEELYVPPYASLDGTTSTSFDWLMTLITEI